MAPEAKAGKTWYARGLEQGASSLHFHLHTGSREGNQQVEYDYSFRSQSQRDTSSSKDILLIGFIPPQTASPLGDQVFNYTANLVGMLHSEYPSIQQHASCSLLSHLANFGQVIQHVKCQFSNFLMSTIWASCTMPGYFPKAFHVNTSQRYLAQ